MVLTQQLLDQLERDEGCQLRSYKDSVGVWTIGYGHTEAGLGPGVVWTQKQADAQLVVDATALCGSLDIHLPWVSILSPARRDALHNMAFNLGVHGLLGFNTFLSYMQKGDFPMAALDLKGTKWAGQVKDRAVRLARQIVSDVYV